MTAPSRPSASPLSDSVFAAAVASMQQRSEKQDEGKLVSTYVDTGILAQVDNANNQIVYGRRGTGKTHAFRVLAAQQQQRGDRVVLAIDARTIGSTHQYSDSSVPAGTRALALFRDILLSIADAVQIHVLKSAPSDSHRALSAVEALSRVALDPVREYHEKTLVDRTKEVSGEQESLSLQIGKDPQLTIFDQLSAQRERERTATLDVATSDKIIFPALHSALEESLSCSGTQLVLLLDEWASLPREVQPYLAEFIKRGLLPNRRVTLKIATLEHRSAFNHNTSTRIIGFELGSDISTALDLDEYYTLERSERSLATAFADVLLRHLASELPDGYLAQMYQISEPQHLLARLFRDGTVLRDALRASHGVLRDFLSIVARSFVLAQIKGSRTIESRFVRDAAKEWYQRDKLVNIPDDLQECLRTIATDTIKRSRTHSFVLPHRYQENLALQRLLDGRVLHIIKRGHTLGGRIGEYFNVYTLDYGLYVDFLTAPSDTPDSLHSDHFNICSALDEAEAKLAAL